MWAEGGKACSLLICSRASTGTSDFTNERRGELQKSRINSHHAQPIICGAKVERNLRVRDHNRQFASREGPKSQSTFAHTELLIPRMIMGSWTPARVTFLQVGFERLGDNATTANGNRFDKYVQQVLGNTDVHDMKLPHRVLFNYMPSVIMY